MTGVSLMDIWGVSTADRGDNKYKDSEEGACLSSVMYVKEAVWLKQNKRGRVMGCDAIVISRGVL